MATLLQLRTMVRDLLADAKNYTPSGITAVAAQTYSDSQINDAINFACKQYAGKTRCTYDEVACTTSPSTSYYTIPSAYLEIVDVLSNTGLRLEKSTIEFEYLCRPNWKATWSVNSAPKRWLQIDGSTIAVNPGFPSGLYPKVCMLEVPTTLALDADTVDARIDTSSQEYLKYAAGAYLLQIDGDEQSIQLADKWLDQFNRLIAGGGI